MMMPFTLTSGDDYGLADFALPEGTCWQPAKMGVDCGVFLSHIQRFLQASVSEHVRRKYAPAGDYHLRDCDYHIYSVDPKAVVHRHVLTQRLMVPLDQGTAFTIGTRPTSFLSPKLVVCPNAAVGLLMLPFMPMLGDHPDIKQMVRFNYLLHKTDGQSCRISVDSSPDNRRYRKACRRGDIDYAGSDQKLAEALGVDCDSDTGRVWFTMSHLLAALMRGIAHSRFNDDMLHVFSYIELDPEVFAADTAIRYHFTRLAMCISDRYRVTNEQVDQVMRPGSFENVYMSSTTSGGAIMTVVGDNSPQYLKEFATGSLQPRYLWIYVMMLMQRHSLLNITNWVIDIDIDRDGDGDRDVNHTLERVRRAVRRMSELTVNNRFSSVSDYTQHNSFYHQCCDVLGIDTLHAEVEQKLNILGDLAEQLSTERKEQVDASKEFWQAALAVIVAVLTMFSATNDGVEAMVKMGLSEQAVPWATVILLAIIFGLGLWLVGLRFIRLYGQHKTEKRKPK